MITYVAALYAVQASVMVLLHGTLSWLGLSCLSHIWTCRVEDVEKLVKSPLIAKEIPIYGVIYHCEASGSASQARTTHLIPIAECQYVGLELPFRLNVTKGCSCTQCHSVIRHDSFVARQWMMIARQAISTSTVLWRPA